MKKMDKKAFTLIELIVVVAVVGILVLLGMPRFIGYKDKAELARIQHDVKVMEQEIGTVLINHDDDFNNWEDNSKDFNQLIQENRLFEKEGIADKVEPIDESYKVIPEKYKDKINTKLKGTFYANNDGKVYYEHGKGLGYSDEERPTSVTEVPVGWIPIWDEHDLAAIGSGNQYDDTDLYFTYDAKYIQMDDIDMESVAWTPIGTEETPFSGHYNGNHHIVEHLTDALFGVVSEIGTTVTVPTIENLYLENNIVDKSLEQEETIGALVNKLKSGAVINHIKLINTTVRGVKEIGGLIGTIDIEDEPKFKDTLINDVLLNTVNVEGKESVSGLVGDVNSSGKLTISSVDGSIDVKGLRIDDGRNNNTRIVGGVVGWSNTNGDFIIDDVNLDGTVTADGIVVGGIGAEILSESNISITNSSFNGTVIGTQTVGGAFGYIEAEGYITIEGVSVEGEVNRSEFVGDGFDSMNRAGYFGGVVGYLDTFQGVSLTNLTFNGNIISTANDVGGIVGYLGNYSGQSDTTVLSDLHVWGLINSSYLGPVRGKYIGGIIGELYLEYPLTIFDTSFTGDITGTTYVGGVTGFVYVADGSIKFEKNEINSNINANDNIGGIVGYSENAGGNLSIIDSTFTGHIASEEDAQYVGDNYGYANVEEGYSIIFE